MPGRADDSPIIIGKLIGAHGVKGWLKVYSWTQPRENILGYNPWLIRQNGQWRSVEVKGGRRQGKSIVACLEGIDDRDQALALRDAEIAIRRDQLQALEDGEYYWSDLIGMEVRNLAGEKLGEVIDLMETGVEDVLVIGGDSKRLVPFAQPQIVKSVDLEGGVIVVDWELDYLDGD